MARKIHSRLKIYGTLVAESPIHVGGKADNPAVDLALAVNGQGQYYIPGTSLAGAFRGWMRSHSAESKLIIDALWGFQEPENNGNDDLNSSLIPVQYREQRNNAEAAQGQASFLLIEDAIVEGKVVEIRDGVGIDRFLGSAAEYIKYDRAILPKGSRIKFQITLEKDALLSDESWNNIRSLCGNLFQSLQDGEIRIGAAKTRGIGKVKLQNVKVCEQELLTRTGMLATLFKNSDSKKELAQLLPPLETRRQQELKIKIIWEPVSSVMVKAEQDGIAVDILPLTSANGDRLTFVLPGSSIKGALRTQAERIVRTVLSLPILKQADSKQRFIQQLETVPLVGDLFGKAAKIENEKQKGLIGVLSVDDCYANLDIDPQAWAQVETSKEGINGDTKKSYLREALDRANLNKTQQAFHIAVDRWTGGAANGFLYSNLELMGITWQPIHITLDIARLKNLDLPIALLLLVLRDLSAGRIPLGYGTNRGMGAIKVSQIVINSQGIDESLSALSDISITDRIITGNSELLNRLNQSWTNWMNNFRSMEGDR